jgi:hypothetical protein
LRHCEDELALVHDLERGDATDEAHLCGLVRYDLGTDHGGRKHEYLRRLEAIRGN